MSQIEKAKRFSELHIKGTPLKLYNAWDAGSAKTIADAGARAIATTSWGVAAAQGYADGEAIPLQFVHQIVGRIAAVIDLPLSVDFEGGYSANAEDLKANISALLDLGVAGINFEDRIVKGPGLYDIAQQARRIRAIRDAAEAKGVALFINARTDVFLGRGGADPVQDVLNRAQAYSDAGASGIFIPGMKDEADIALVCDRIVLPVNILVLEGVPSNARLAELGVSRISYGSQPYVRTAAFIQESGWRALS